MYGKAGSDPEADAAVGNENTVGAMLQLWLLDPPASKQRAFATPTRKPHPAARNAVILFYATILLVGVSVFLGPRAPPPADLLPSAGATEGSTASTRSRLAAYPDMRVADTPPFQSAADRAAAREAAARLAAAREESIASANRTYADRFPAGEEPAARLIVLTMDRAGPLERLLRSLAAADYSDDHVDLDIWVDRRAGAPLDARVLAAAAAIEWPFGAKTIHARRAAGGLYQQWIYTWNIRDQTDEVAVILEDDLEVAPAFYQWLKQARAAYATDPEVGAFTLQRSTLRPRPGRMMGKLALARDVHVFKYRLLGTWGFAPQRDVWLEFRAWFERMREKGEKPYVDDLITTRWYKEQERDGFAPHMWSQWWIRFVDEKGYFTVTPHLPDGSTLSANWREGGMHYSKTKPSRDFPVYGGAAEFTFPESPMRIDWDGREVKQ